jgi:hypothetical protein
VLCSSDNGIVGIPRGKVELVGKQGREWFEMIIKHKVKTTTRSGVPFSHYFAVDSVEGFVYRKGREKIGYALWHSRDVHVCYRVILHICYLVFCSALLHNLTMFICTTNSEESMALTAYDTEACCRVKVLQEFWAGFVLEPVDGQHLVAAFKELVADSRSLKDPDQSNRLNEVIIELQTKCRVKFVIGENDTGK